MNWIDHLKAFDRVFGKMGRLNADIEHAAAILTAAAKSRKPILVCGNGGSAADSLHFSAELTGRFSRPRPPVKCLSLASDAAFLTAWANDTGYVDVFARQVLAHGEPSGVLVAISTSGKSANVNLAVSQAQKLGMKALALTGSNGMAECSPDLTLKIPSEATPLIQQGHEIVLHFLAQRIEDSL